MRSGIVVIRSGDREYWIARLLFSPDT